MHNIVTIVKKEFRSYFYSPVAYIFITAFLVFSGWLFFRSFFIANQADLRGFFIFLPWIYLFFVPAVTMRLWSEERKSGTMEVLMTLPINDYEAVIGKYLGAFLFLTVSLILSFPIVVVVSYLGDPDGGAILGGYAGSVLLGGAYLAIGLFISSTTRNQIVAFIISVSICFLFLMVGESLITETAPKALVPFLSFMGLGTHFHSIGRGVIDSRDLIYYLSVILFFLYANIRFIERTKWR